MPSARGYPPVISLKSLDCGADAFVFVIPGSVGGSSRNEHRSDRGAATSILKRFRCCGGSIPRFATVCLQSGARFDPTSTFRGRR